MSRTLRIEYPGAVYHVQSEGNRGDAIYLDDEDRETFLRTFQEAARSAHRRLRQIEYRTQAADHPILWAGDETSYYLKFYIFQVVDEK